MKITTTTDTDHYKIRKLATVPVGDTPLHRMQYVYAYRKAGGRFLREGMS
jgi:hypothetical protein